jgi:hypothetical protein
VTAIATSPRLLPLALRAPSARSIRLTVVAICLFSAFLGRFCFLIRPLDNDAAIFIYMGKMVATGGRLCHDLIDNKFPTVGLMMSILWRTLGTCWPAYIALQMVLSLASSWMLGRSAARVSGAFAQLPTTLFAIVFLNFTTAVFGGFQLETVQVFFTVLAASSILKILDSPGRKAGAIKEKCVLAFLVGLSIGCGMMLKPTAIGILAAFFFGLPLTSCNAQKKGTIFVFALAGLAIPLSGVLLYLIEAQLLGDMPGLYRQISTYARESVFDLADLAKPVTALLLLGFPMVIRGLVCRRDRADSMHWPISPVMVFTLAWLVIETAGVIMQRRMYAYHFLPMVPPAALLFGFIPRVNRPGALAAALLPIAFLSVNQACDLIATTRPGETPMPVSQYLITHTKRGDAVWMDAWPRLVLETGLKPASRLPFTFLFTNYDGAGLDYSAGIIADFERTKPAYIILPMPLQQRMQYQIDFIPELYRRPIRQVNYITGWRRIERYTLEHYTKETIIGNDAVYRRRP